MFEINKKYISVSKLYIISVNLGIPYITDCVMAEIEKLGMKYRVALRYEFKLALITAMCMNKHLFFHLLFNSFYLFILSYFYCRIAKDPRFERLPCTHKGTYADDCLVQRVTQVNYMDRDV